jgi:hypothetical protein
MRRRQRRSIRPRFRRCLECLTPLTAEELRHDCSWCSRCSGRDAWNARLRRPPVAPTPPARQQELFTEGGMP